MFCEETFNYSVLRWRNIETKLHKAGDNAASLWPASAFILFPVVPSSQFASLWDCSIWGPPCRAWCRRSAPRWRPAARRTRRGWGCRTRWGPPADLNSGWKWSCPSLFLTRKWQHCVAIMSLLTHGAVVTDPLVHGLGDPRLGQPGAAPHRHQQPHHPWRLELSAV